jgi:hypothetical protein
MSEQLTLERPRDARELSPYWWQFRQPRTMSETRKIVGSFRRAATEIRTVVPEFWWQVEERKLYADGIQRGRVYLLSYVTPMRAGIIASYEAQTGALSVKHRAVRDWHPDGDPIEPAIPIAWRHVDEARWHQSW